MVGFINQTLPLPIVAFVALCSCDGKTQNGDLPDSAPASTTEMESGTSAATDGGSLDAEPTLDATTRPADAGTSSDAWAPGTDALVSIPDGGMPLGTFVGFVQDYTFPSGSNALFLKLALGSDGVTVTGIIVLGNEVGLPQPSNPNVGYPPGYEGFPTFDELIVEGYAFTALSGALHGSLLELQINTFEAWSAWCEEQTPTAFMGNYGCTPPGWACSGMPPNNCSLTPPDAGSHIAIDCGKQALCGGCPNGQAVCTCTIDGCSVPLEGVGQFATFQLTVSSQDLSGSVNMLPMAMRSVGVQLTKQ